MSSNGLIEIDPHPVGSLPARHSGELNGRHAAALRGGGERAAGSCEAKLRQQHKTTTAIERRSGHCRIGTYS